MFIFAKIIKIFYLGVDMKKELGVMVGIFLFLAIGMHFKEWTSHPLEHLLALPHAGAYGIGMVHPLVFTLIVYGVFALGRGVVRLFTKK